MPLTAPTFLMGAGESRNNRHRIITGLNMEMLPGHEVLGTRNLPWQTQGGLRHPSHRGIWETASKIVLATAFSALCHLSSTSHGMVVGRS